MTIRELIEKKGIQKHHIANKLNYSDQLVGYKVKRDSWTYQDLVELYKKEIFNKEDILNVLEK